MLALLDADEGTYEQALLEFAETVGTLCLPVRYLALSMSTPTASAPLW
jgi:hypothetical protein